MTGPEHVDISVVIGFKDWGRDRVAIAVKSLRRAFGELSGEVIVSDYGSREPGREQFAEDIRRIGGRYVYTETDGTWSRARALNAGFAVSRGRVLVSTDADMLFSERSLEVVAKRILGDPSRIVALQCRDLPEGSLPNDFDGEDIDWSGLRQAGRLRPRWGMGGMMACTREAYLHVRGLDERMVIYGGEDIDFANRLRRSGHRLEWITDERVRMYHMWHPPTRSIASATDAGATAIENNRRIHLQDPSFIRNVTRWRHAPKGREIPTTVVISTFNRADHLSDAINSVLAQTMGDFELIIVDDGSTDHTRDVVAGYDDERIRYFHRDRGGLAAARNFAADQSRGRFTVIHDDDDIMLPWRLASHFDALCGDMRGTYGAWADFNDSDGALTAHLGKDLSLGSLLFSSKVYLHPTLMLDTDILRKLQYDETLRSGSDYNLGIRLMRSGLKLGHTGEFHILRRLHPNQVTAVDGELQKMSAVLSTFMARTPMSAEGTKKARAMQKNAGTPTVRGAKDVFGLVGAYLPDRLVRRRGELRMDGVEVDQEGRDIVRNLSSRFMRLELPDGSLDREVAFFGAMDWKTMAGLGSRGIYPEIMAERIESQHSSVGGRLDGPKAESDFLSRCLEMALDSKPRSSDPYAFVLSSQPITTGNSTIESAEHIYRIIVEGDRVLHLGVFQSNDLQALGAFLEHKSEAPGVVHSGAWVPKTIASSEAVEQLAGRRHP